MAGKIIVAASGGKGGVGKSALLVNIAGCLSEMGHKVCMVDVDTPDDDEAGTEGAQSVMTFGRVRQRRIEKGDDIPHIETYMESRNQNLTNKLKDLSKIYDYVLVDTPGSTSVALKSAIALSYSVLLPMNMQRDEFLPLPPIIRLIRSIEENFSMVGIDRKIDALLVPTRLNKSSKIFKNEKDRAEFIYWYEKNAADVSGICKVLIPDVAEFRQLVSYGKTVCDLKNTEYRGIFQRLIGEIEGERSRYRYRASDEAEAAKTQES
jgi:cellulose biosynthesis protein BcsQ